VVVGDVYDGRRVLQWLSTSGPGWVVIEKFALWLLVPVAIMVVVASKV
jgi:hypothetical protein